MCSGSRPSRLLFKFFFNWPLTQFFTSQRKRWLFWEYSLHSFLLAGSYYVHDWHSMLNASFSSSWVPALAPGMSLMKFLYLESYLGQALWILEVRYSQSFVLFGNWFLSATLLLSHWVPWGIGLFNVRLCPSGSLENKPRFIEKSNLPLVKLRHFHFDCMFIHLQALYLNCKAAWIELSGLNIKFAGYFRFNVENRFQTCNTKWFRKCIPEKYSKLPLKSKFSTHKTN